MLGRCHPVMLGQGLDDVMLGRTSSATRDFFFLRVAVVPVAIGVHPNPPQFDDPDPSLKFDVEKLAVRVRNSHPDPRAVLVVRVMRHLRRLALSSQIAPKLLKCLGRLPRHEFARLLVVGYGALLTIVLFLGRVMLRLILSADDI